MGSQRVGRDGATFTHSLRKTDFSLSDSAVAVCSSHGYPPQRCSFRHPLKYFLRRRLLCSRQVQLPNALAKRELPARKPREPSPHCSEAELVSLQAGLCVAGPGPVLFIHFGALMCRPVSHVVRSCGPRTRPAETRRWGPAADR